MPSGLSKESVPLSQSDLNQLAQYGYVSLDGDRHADLLAQYSSLLSISSDYFALDDDDDAKRKYRAPTGPGASEEGHSRILGEKQIFTCRALHRTPSNIRQVAQGLWKTTGVLLGEVIDQIVEDLDLVSSSHGNDSVENPFKPLLNHCLNLTNDKTPTLLRLFRYDRPLEDVPSSQDTHIDSSRTKLGLSSASPHKSHIVAEQHKDLGLLSLVVGSSSGLEVLNGTTNEWIPIEEPNHSRTKCHGLTMTLLNGQCLRYLTRNQYRAGVHRVRVSPRTLADGRRDPHRFSIVFALRPFPSELNLSSFESSKVGTFSSEERAGIDGQSAMVLFNKICGQHWNVNIAKDIREKQRQSTEPAHVSTASMTSVPVGGIPPEQIYRGVQHKTFSSSTTKVVVQDSYNQKFASSSHGQIPARRRELPARSRWISKKWVALKELIHASRSTDLNSSS